jgi:hypothetical protein
MEAELYLLGARAQHFPGVCDKIATLFASENKDKAKKADMDREISTAIRRGSSLKAKRTR